jgi:hypothetical protein
LSALGKVLLLLHHFHQAEAGQFDVEDVRFFAAVEAGGLQEERPLVAQVPEQADARGQVVAAADLQQILLERDLGVYRNALGPHAHRPGGNELGHADATAVDLEREGHSEDSLAGRAGVANGAGPLLVGGC